MEYQNTVFWATIYNLCLVFGCCLSPSLGSPMNNGEQPKKEVIKGQESMPVTTKIHDPWKRKEKTKHVQKSNNIN